jgi:hypothetical protein
MKGLSAIEKDLIGIFRFTPTINLLDNRSQFVAPYRTLYYEIEKLGQSFGFSCEPIDSTFWAKTKKRLSNPYIWAVLVAGAGLSWLWQSSTTSTPPSQLDGITSGIQAPTPAKAPGIFESFGQGFKQ